MKDILLKLKNKSVIISLLGILILLVTAGFFLNSFALIEPVSSINFTSQKLNYETKEPGSYKVEKSAKWISHEKARITFNVDTVLKTKNKNRDIILVLDVSGSMEGNKLTRVKEDTKDLINVLLSNPENKAALITFDTTSSILSEFTNNKKLLIDKINALEADGTTNYYQALINVENLLQNYTKEADKDLITLFLTDGYPNVDVPNEIAEYNYLKQQYPYQMIHGIQYEMGESILEPIKKVSDNQFIADITSLNNVLFDASVVPNIYDSFTLTDYIDMDNFKVENENDIKVSMGKVTFDEEEQKITWTIDNLKTGSKPSMTIDIIQKEETRDKELLPTNKKESVESKLDSVEENIESDKTPVLKGRYQVIYEGNAPSGCSVSNLPEIKSYHVFDTVEIDSNQLVCEGYQFKGWKIVTGGVTRVNQDYFQMPESDVVIRAEWSSLSISKMMDGEVYEYIPSPIRKVSYDDNNDIWGYRNSVTKVVFQNELNKIEGIEEFDISETQNGNVMAYVTPNLDDSSMYTVYIQGNGRILANENSSNLFYGFDNLELIEGLEYLDTSNVEDMSYMFSGCRNLISLDVSHFDTSKVENMVGTFSGCRFLPNLDLSGFNTFNVINMTGLFSQCHMLNSLDVSSFDTSNVIYMDFMFDDCSSLRNLDLSGFDTSDVTSMSGMFYECNILENLDISSLNTSKVIDMSSMFWDCSDLINLDLSHFDTSKVTDMSDMFNGCSSLISLGINKFNTLSVTNMSSMFYNCSNLTSLDLSNFDTSKVTDMSDMFCGCDSLTSLVVSKFDTSNVTNMSSMFHGCSNLISLDLSHFDTSKVTNMSYMFRDCSSLTNLDLSGFDTTNISNMNYMFTNCAKLNTVISINNPKTTRYVSMFSNAATDNAQIIVDYIDSTSDLVDKMIATKSENSNVIKRQNYNAAEIEYSNESYTTCNNVSCALDELYNIFGGNR